MFYRRIDIADINEIATFASKVFAEDPFFDTLARETKDRARKLIPIFRSNISICIDHGIAHAAYSDEGALLGYMLAFDYHQLHAQHPEEFFHLFHIPNAGKRMNRKQEAELNIIESQMQSKSQAVYLLSIAVAATSRLSGIASELLRMLSDSYPDYYIFADISHESLSGFYKSNGFEETYCCPDFSFFVRVPSATDLLSDHNLIHIAIPQASDLCERFDIQPVMSIDLAGFSYLDPQSVCFCPSLGSTALAKVYAVSFEQLLFIQQSFDLVLASEIILRRNNKDLVFYTVKERYQQIRSSVPLDQPQLCERLIPDIITSIPIECTNKSILANPCTNRQSSVCMEQLLAAVAFRTEYESGIPSKILATAGFQHRIIRKFLGFYSLQLRAETTIRFLRDPISAPLIGLSCQVGLIISYDDLSNCGVLHIVALSSAFATSQYLDSVSRNDVSFCVNDEYINLFDYLYQEYGILKKGSAKNFLTFPYDRAAVDDSYLAALLFCETYYAEGESIGKIIDEPLLSIIAKPYGMGQYNYASLFCHTNALINISKHFRNTVSERIIYESITMFYVELVAFEEAAIMIANDRISHFLSQIERFHPQKVLSSVYQIMNNYVKTTDFWDVQMNYPSSKRSVDLIRESFRIEQLRKTVDRNLKNLDYVYQARSDIIDKRESSLLSVIGAMLTVISVINLVIDPSKHQVLFISGAIVGVFLILKFLVFSKSRHK